MSKWQRRECSLQSHPAGTTRWHGTRHPQPPTLSQHMRGAKTPKQTCRAPKSPRTAHRTPFPTHRHRVAVPWCRCRCGALTAAGVGAGALGRAPGQVVVEVLAALAVGALRVVLADAAPVDLGENTRLSPAARPCGAPCRAVPCQPHHAGDGRRGAGSRSTLGGVAVAEAAPAQHQLVHGVVVLVQHLLPRVQQVVPQRVQLGEVHPQVGDAQQVCAGQAAGSAPAVPLPGPPSRPSATHPGCRGCRDLPPGWRGPAP